jgi:hypothetical protein
MLLDRGHEEGLDSVVNIGGLMLVDPKGEDSLAFTLRHFGL